MKHTHNYVVQVSCNQNGGKVSYVRDYFYLQRKRGGGAAEGLNLLTLYLNGP